MERILIQPNLWKKNFGKNNHMGSYVALKTRFADKLKKKEFNLLWVPLKNNKPLVRE